MPPRLPNGQLRLQGERHRLGIGKVVPFLDGNKRTAVAAADVHLRMNGFELAGDSMEHYRFLVGLMEAGDLDWRAIEAWLRDNAEES